MLSVADVSAGYGAIRAVRSVRLDVEENEIVTIVGPNGSGKTTLLRTISGLHRSSAGRIMFCGRDITALPAYRVVEEGITQVLQGRQIFSDLTVLENLRMGLYRFSSLSAAEVKRALDEIYTYFPVLSERQRQKGGTLSGGEQVMLAIGRALMSRPKLLILDEPSFGLAPKVVDVVFDALQRLHRNGRTILLVEQNAELAFDLASRGYLMVLGAIAVEGSCQALRRSEQVIDLYLGQRGS